MLIIAYMGPFFSKMMKKSLLFLTTNLENLSNVLNLEKFFLFKAEFCVLDPLKPKNQTKIIWPELIIFPICIKI